MSPLVELLQRLDRDGFSLSADDDKLILAPGSRLTPELEAEILHHKPDLLSLACLHGHSLANLFKDPPTWPRPRGRSGVLADPDAILRAIRRPVRLRDGRDGILRAILYETRTGRTRCRVELSSSESLSLDPEDVIPLTVAEGRSA